MLKRLRSWYLTRKKEDLLYRKYKLDKLYSRGYVGSLQESIETELWDVEAKIKRIEEKLK